MDVTREHISRILELREMLLWFQTGRCCCRLCYPGEYLRLGTLVIYNWARYSKLVTVLGFCLFTLIFLLMQWCVVVVVFFLVCFSSAWSSRHWSPCRRLWRLCQDAQLILTVLLALLLSHRCHQKAENGNCSASSADGAFMIFWGVCHDPF